jgi:hypothetical protein
MGQWAARPSKGGSISDGSSDTSVKQEPAASTWTGLREPRRSHPRALLNDGNELWKRTIPEAYGAMTWPVRRGIPADG